MEIALIVGFIVVLPCIAYLFYVLFIRFGWSLRKSCYKVIGIDSNDDTSLIGSVCGWSICATCLAVLGYKNNPYIIPPTSSSTSSLSSTSIGKDGEGEEDRNLSMLAFFALRGSLRPV